MTPGSTTHMAIYAGLSVLLLGGYILGFELLVQDSGDFPILIALTMALVALAIPMDLWIRRQDRRGVRGSLMFRYTALTNAVALALVGALAGAGVWSSDYVVGTAIGLGLGTALSWFKYRGRLKDHHPKDVFR